MFVKLIYVRISKVAVFYKIFAKWHKQGPGVTSLRFSTVHSRESADAVKAMAREDQSIMDLLAAEISAPYLHIETYVDPNDPLTQ